MRSQYRRRPTAITTTDTRQIDIITIESIGATITDIIYAPIGRCAAMMALFEEHGQAHVATIVVPDTIISETNLPMAGRAYVHLVSGALDVNGQRITTGDALMPEGENRIPYPVEMTPKCWCSILHVGADQF